ncbi:MAG: response regulator transcription factor [Eubacterium sp.]|nr:response regulator transcription factor [Eubacterium sp.]
MIHIAICDDEPCMSDALRQMVSAFFCGKNIDTMITQYTSGEQLLRSQKKIDILFLDIQMGGLSGMETAKKLRRRKFKGFLIFITVLREMVFDAFEVQAFDYLVKPIDETRFEHMMGRLLSSLQDAGSAGLLIQKGYESSIIPFEDIVFCEIIDRKVYVHLVSSEIIDFYDRIDHLETKLDDSFFRCHRSFLIHLKYLKSYKNGTAYMENGKEIPVSRLRSKEFSSVILRYMKRQ